MKLFKTILAILIATCTMFALAVAIYIFWKILVLLLLTFSVGLVATAVLAGVIYSIFWAFAYLNKLLG